MAQTQGMNPPNRRWLERVQVDFTGDRPRNTLKLVVAVDQMKYTQKIGKSDSAIIWEGRMPCLTTSVCSVKLSKEWPFRRKVVAKLPFARVKDSETYISLPIANSNAIVTFTFAMTHDKPQQEEPQPAVASSSGVTSEPSKQPDKPDDLASRARSVGEGVAAAATAIDGQHVILDKLGKARDFIKIINSVVTAVGAIHPAAGVAAAAVGSLLEICEKQAACRDAAKDLTKELDILLTIKGHISVLEHKEGTSKAVERMLKLVAGISDYIREGNPGGSSSSGAFKHLFAGDYGEKIDRFKKEFAHEKDAFDRSVRLEAYKIGHDTEQDMVLQRLHPVDEAHYLSEDGQTCLDDTRVELRTSTMGWVESSEPEPVLRWLFGHAGSGKTCVARTIAEQVKKLGFGLSCFFCKRDDPSLSKPANVLRTLSFRFAEQHDDYRSALVTLLRSSDGVDALSGDIKKQFELLFERLLAEVKARPQRPHVIVVDALDECGTAADQKLLAEVLLGLARAAPWVKVFVTSRAETGIHRVFLSRSSTCFAIDINDEAQTESDIRRFLVTKLAELELSLQDDQINLLVKQAAGLFIWCTTLFDYVSRSFDPMSRLEQFLSPKAPEDSQAEHPHHHLHVLYEKVLTTAAKDGEDLSFLRTVLGVVYVTAAYRPIPVLGIANCLKSHARYKGRSKTAVGNVIRALHAVLREDAQSHGAVRVYHTSFLDFLRTKLMSEDGWERPEEIHALMLRSCLATMHRELKFNICGLDDASVLNKDVPDLLERISKYISHELQYSAEFWSDHLIESGSATNEEILSEVTALLSTPKALFWLEVMSLLGLVSRSAAMLRSCSGGFQARPELRATAFDLERLVTSFADAMESAPHIYLSVLPWLPTKSLTYQNVETSFKHIPSISGNDDDWSALLLTKSVGSPVRCVACSPDGGYFVIGLQDNTVCVRDAHTGVAVGEALRGHTDWVRSVAYSPNGRYIVSGSDDCTVHVWDAHTGAAVGEALRGHEGWVLSVGYSPDGQYIVSGSEDRTVRVWDARTGAAVGEAFRGHDDEVNSVGYSPDGQHIVSGSDDGTVRVWDAHTGAAVGEALRGHEGRVQSVAYSPDGRYIVSGSSDRAVRVWDAHTGAAVGESLRGHEGWVLSVAYSPDGRYIVSGSSDRTVRAWDARTGAAVREPLRGHEGWVLSVAYSPDGQYIVSGSSDRTVGVWDVHTGAAVGEALRGHEDVVRSVAYSPDGQYIVSGSSDHTVGVWDAHTGAAVGEALRGHEGWVLSVGYSPDGQYIVSGSSDRTVRVWDARTGAAVGEALRGHEGGVSSVAYSPDGQYIVSSDYSHCTIIWDACSRTAVDDPPQGIIQVTGGSDDEATSPDGRFRASTSGDRMNIDVGEAWAPTETAEASTMMPDPLHYNKHWNACCSRMADTDAWVKNGDELLLWVPYRYRYVLRRRLLFAIGTKGERKPAVDLDKLYSYSGTRWMQIYAS